MTRKCIGPFGPTQAPRCDFSLVHARVLTTRGVQAGRAYRAVAVDASSVTLAPSAGGTFEVTLSRPGDGAASESFRAAYTAVDAFIALVGQP